MRKLIIEGWIHHMCRVSLAVFLTRGHLFLSWEWGLKTFLKYQIDVRNKTVNLHSRKAKTYLSYSTKADWSVCAGNWSWISSGSPAEALYDTFSFCPVRQGSQLDPDGKFTR